MACVLWGGQREWGGGRDEAGYRTFKVKWLVKAALADGPFNVMNTPGLPLPGSAWLIDGDSDPWSWCRPDMAVAIHQPKEGDPNYWWTVEQTFSNKPPDRDKQKCQDDPVEDPLLEPQKVSGGFTRFSEEAAYDRSGDPINNSSHEQVRGPQIEFDRNRPTVRVEQNVALLGLATWGPMIDTVNDAPLWGLDARCVKLSNASWERKYHGLCSLYYTRSFDFDVNESTFDRDLLDEGTKCLRGAWDRNSPSATFGTWVVALGPGGLDLDPARPGNFMRFKDWNGENARVVLDGHGRPWDPRVDPATGDLLAGGAPDSVPGKIHVEKYPESNFLLLGIPTVL